MQPVLITTDAVLLSFARSVLADAGIAAEVADQFMSSIEGSVGVLPRRLMVRDDALAGAREALIGAGLGKELVQDDGRGRS